MFEWLARICAGMGRKRLSLPFGRVKQDPTDDEVVRAIRSVPTHFVLPTVILGYEAYCTIGAPAPETENPITFGIKGGRISLAIDTQECGDSNTGAPKSEKPGRYQATVNFDFYEKNDTASAVIFVTGTPITTTQTLDVELFVRIYPDGNTTKLKNPWIFPSLVCSTYDLNWDNDGKMNGTVSGKSNGTFTIPQN